MTYQEGGQSFIASKSKFVKQGKGIQTICVNGNGCEIKEVNYDTYSFDGETLRMSGQDEFGTFNLVGTVNDEEDVTVAKKTYIDSTLVLDMTIDGVPTDSNMFFAGFTFAANTGKEGNGRMVYALSNKLNHLSTRSKPERRTKIKRKRARTRKTSHPQRHHDFSSENTQSIDLN